MLIGWLLSLVLSSVEVRSVPAPRMVADAANLCVRAISPSGINDQIFREAGWDDEPIPEYPGIHIYRKTGLRITLGVRKDVGGSCIIQYATPNDYDLRDTSTAIALATGGIFIFHTNLPTGANLRLPGKIISVQSHTEQSMNFAMVQVEILP